MKLDSVLLEIMGRKVSALADEMNFALQRASRSIYVKEAADFATAILDPAGQVFAYPPSATFCFLIDTDYISTIRAVPDLEPGDVIITNDPYESNALSTHLPDIHMLQPYFHDGEIIGYGWCFVHCTDIGGSVPSSMSPALTEIFQEGLRIPPMKFMKRGEINKDLFDLFMANTRAPDVNTGDLKAMVGALETGARRLGELIAIHGIDTLKSAQKDLPEYTAEKARNVLRKIPDGDYDFCDYMDDDMVSRVPVRVRVRMTAKDGHIHLDVTGTDPQVKTAYNVPTMGGRNYWISFRLSSFLTTYDQSMLRNSGMYRSISVTNPPGTILNAEYPDAVGIRASAPWRLSDAVCGAIHKANPELMPAVPGGTMCPFALAEFAPDGETRHVQVIQPVRCGMGALKGRDGVDARDNSMNNMRNHPTETVEAESGVITTNYDIRTDSGGPGQWRGGVAQVITVEVLRDGGVFVARGVERLRFPPWGVGGGKPGATLRSVFNLGREDEREVGKIHELKVDRGDTLTLMLPGGGGYGNPLLRDAGRVLEDVIQGFVSEEGATRDYGVVVRGDILDQAATEALRRARQHEISNAYFNFGPDREAWEAVFDDATMGALNEKLYGLPKSTRQDKRRWIFEETVPGLKDRRTVPFTELITDPDAARGRLAQAMESVFGSLDQAAE